MPSTPHDNFFKAIFSQPRQARAVLRTLMPPALARHLDFDTLAPQSGSFVDNELRGRFSDLLFTVRYAGHFAFLYLLFEHQSTPDPLMPFRLLRYMVEIWTKHLRKNPNATRLPAILPVVLHHSEGGWRTPMSMGALYDLPAEVQAPLAGYLPDFTFLLDDLSTQTDEDLRQRALDAISRLGLWALARVRNQDDLLAALGQVSDLILAVYRASGGLEALALVMRYIMEVSGTRSEELKRFLQTEIDPMAHQVLLTEAERLRKEGRKEGHKEGRKEGGLEILQALLQERFGTLPADVQVRLADAESKQLALWGRRVLSARSLDEVFA